MNLFCVVWNSFSTFVIFKFTGIYRNICFTISRYPINGLIDYDLSIIDWSRSIDYLLIKNWRLLIDHDLSILWFRICFTISRYSISGLIYRLFIDDNLWIIDRGLSIIHWSRSIDDLLIMIDRICFIMRRYPINRLIDHDWLVIYR